MTKKEREVVEGLVQALRRIERMHREYDPMCARGITAEIARGAIAKAEAAQVTAYYTGLGKGAP
jgi:hypothetical protein